VANDTKVVQLAIALYNMLILGALVEWRPLYDKNIRFLTLEMSRKCQKWAYREH